MRAILCLLLLLSLVAAAAAAAGDGPGGVSWNPGGGGSAWSVALDGGDGTAAPTTATPLEAPIWREPLPELPIPLLGGGSFPLPSARGKVLLLDFWASWCAPCVEELPRLQELFTAEEPRGLVALAINVGEPAATARRAAASLKLTLPIGTLNRAVGEAFHPSRLPALVLADRAGKIRERWDGWVPGLERTVAARVRELLAEDAEAPKRAVAEVLSGAGRIRVGWARDVGVDVTGIAAVEGAGEATRIAVASGAEVTIVDADGRVARRYRVPSSSGRIVAADLDGNGQPEIIGFRPGGSELAFADLSNGAVRTLSVPAALLDVAAIDAAPPVRREGTLALATVNGLYLADREGKHIRRVEGTGETPSARPAAKGSAARIAALGADGNVRVVDLDGRIERTAPARPGDAKLVAAEDPSEGFGTAPAATIALASGRFLPGGGTQVAVATGGALVLLDLSKREIVWRARWPGIVDLTAADLDRDGRDDLVVATGRSLAVLRARR
jgi:thiol-disulfide isomerase/thioredoxin